MRRAVYVMLDLKCFGDGGTTNYIITILEPEILANHNIINVTTLLLKTIVNLLKSN